MKNILLTLLLLFAFYSCQEKKKENLSEISIANKENNEKRNEVVISVNDTINSFFTNLFVDKMQYRPDMLYLGKKVNKLTVTIPTDKPIIITGGDPSISFHYKLTLEKGDSLMINTVIIKISQKKQISYPIFEVPNGNRKWCEVNFDYLLYIKNLKNKAIEIDTTKSYLRDKWHHEKMLDNSTKLIDSLKANNSISNDFYSTIKKNQKLKFATSKLREARNEKIEINEDFAIKLNDENLLTNVEYLNYLKELVLYKYFKEDKRVSNSVQFDFINDNETFLYGNTKQALLDSYLENIFFTEKPKFEKYLKKFNILNTNEILKDKWVHLVDAQKLNGEILNKSNRNVGILTNLIDDNKLTFEEILKSHKGKTVLVDFWASWCAPCRKEMPFLKDLKLKFNDTEFKVIEISIDNDYSAWERASKLENLSNEKNNYIISDWEESSLYENYNINTIPRYLLFGKDGKIIDENAPRPSEKELVELIKTSIQ